jgi:NADH-quinone oxidoreductase subunit I
MLGEGIVKGLAETARNFFGSYISRDRLITVQFPEERLPQAEAARNFCLVNWTLAVVCAVVK